MGRLKIAYQHWRQERRTRRKQKLDSADQARRSLEKHPRPRPPDGGAGLGL
jgi:hypothetical protein